MVPCCKNSIFAISSHVLVVFRTPTLDNCGMRPSLMQSPQPWSVDNLIGKFDCKSAMTSPTLLIKTSSCYAVASMVVVPGVCGLGLTRRLKQNNRIRRHLHGDDGLGHLRRHGSGHHKHEARHVLSRCGSIGSCCPSRHLPCGEPILTDVRPTCCSACDSIGCRVPLTQLMYQRMC